MSKEDHTVGLRSVELPLDSANALLVMTTDGRISLK